MGDGNRSSQPVSFNLAEQAGILQALLAVRNSTLSAAEKNDLRDEIFTYTKSGGDERLREQIEKKLQNLPVTEAFVSQQKQQQKKESRAGFAGARRTPLFAIPQPKTATPPSSETTSSKSVEQGVSTPEQTVPQTAAPTSPTAVHLPVQSAVNENVQSKTPSTSPEEDASSAQDLAPKEPTPPSTPKASSSVPQGSPTIDRIREIKRYINEKIGNPVNLVDIDNELGRAYMSALLAAMQSVNAETGRAGDAEMQKLEDIFLQVKSRLDEQSSITPSSAPSNSETTFPEVVSLNDSQGDTSVSTESDQMVSLVVEPTPAPIPPNEPASPTVKDVDIEADVVSKSTKTEEKEVLQEEPVSKTPAVSHAEEVSSRPPIQPVSNVDIRRKEDLHREKPVADIVKENEVVPTVTTPSESNNNLPTNSPVSRFALPVSQEQNTVANQVTVLDAQAAQNQFAGDPLYAPEIDAGLQQLLLEWSLFKSSGLFGTGPNGREHPLFKKLAPLMIQDVAEGRFDEARPEVVQSITDYMNGWRFEQGIVYEPGESFEKYLRRVIRFIIDSKQL